MIRSARNYKAVTIGGSAGSLEVLMQLLPFLPKDYPLPVIVVTHMPPTDSVEFIAFLNEKIPLLVQEAEDKGVICPGHVYFSPPDYHLLVEPDGTFSISFDRKVHYSRPSIDVLFESAAFAWGSALVGILLTGANNDGADGISAIKKYGGLTVAQDPAEAAHPTMPQAAIDTGKVDCILSVAEIGRLLEQLSADHDGHSFQERMNHDLHTENTHCGR